MVKNTIISECLALNTEENARAVLSDVRYCLVVEADEFRHELATRGREELGQSSPKVQKTGKY
jgi:hypothetical protein